MHRLIPFALFMAAAFVAAPASACKDLTAVTLFGAPPSSVPAGAVVLRGRLVREGEAVESYRAQAWQDPASPAAFIGFLTLDDAPDAPIALYAGVSTCHYDTQPSLGGPDVEIYVFGAYVGGADGTPARFEALSEWRDAGDLSGVSWGRN